MLFYKPIIHILLIVVLGLLTYSNTFHASFHFDDNLNIVDNPVIKDLKFFIDPSGATVSPLYKALMYKFLRNRYMGYLTFALNYKLHGLGVTGYHIVNLAIHILNAVLVYWLVRLTLTLRIQDTRYTIHDKEHASCIVHHESGQADSPIHPFTYLPLFIALMFVSHPIQTQAVTYIVQRFASLATMFYLLSLVMYINFRMHDTKKMHDAGYTIHDKENHESCIMNRESCIVSQASCILYLASLFSAVLAMKTKETAIMLPVTITLYEFMFFNDSRFTVHNLRFKKSILYLTPLLLTMLIIPLNLTTAIGLDNPGGELIEDIGKATRGSTSLSRWEYLFTEFRVIVTYIRLLFLPINQNFAYDYPYNSFLNANVFLSFLFLIFMFGLGVYLFYRSRVKKVSVISVSDSKSVPVNSVCVSKKLTLKTDTDTGKDTVYCSLIAFGIFWFFINMMLESSIIPLSNVIFEHRLYLPSIGFIIALSTAIFYFVSRFVYSTSRLSLSTVYCLLSTFVIVLSVATYNRNNIWKDDISLWGDVTRKSHGNGIGSIMSRKNLVMFYNIRGLDYRDRGLLDEAINEYRSALKLDPNIAKTHLNMGVAYKDKGMLDEAIMEYKNALRLKPDYAEVYNNLGVAYKNKGMLDEAVMEYKNALRLKPDYSEIHCNLGVVYRKQGRIDAAIREYKTALKIKPSYMEAHNNLGIAYMQKGMIKEADMEFRTALKFAGIEKP